MASSASDALRRERKYKADDCWVDDEWMKAQSNTASAIGFSLERESPEDF